MRVRKLLRIAWPRGFVRTIVFISTRCSRETAQAGLVIVPMFGTHATKHWYEPYQPLVHAVPMIGINFVLQVSYDDIPSLGCLLLLYEEAMRNEQRFLDTFLALSPISHKPAKAIFLADECCFCMLSSACRHLLCRVSSA